MSDVGYDEEADLLEEAERLTAEYEAAKEAYEANRNSQPSRRRWTAAQKALADARSYWRSIGEAAPDDHPGSRWPVVGVAPDGTFFRSMIKVENNTSASEE